MLSAEDILPAVKFCGKSERTMLEEHTFCFEVEENKKDKLKGCLPFQPNSRGG